MAREAWTDERLDDLTKHMDENFHEVRADLRELRTRVNGLDAKVERLDEKVSGLDAKLDARFDDLNRTLQIGGGLIGVIFLAVIGLIGTQL